MASSAASSSSSSSSREPSPMPSNTKALKRKLQSAQEDAEASGSNNSDSDTEKAPKTTKAKTKEKKQKKSKSEDAVDVSETADAEPTAVPEVEDVPVISHAERRRQKRLAKQLAAEQAAEAEGSVTKKRKLKDGSAKDTSAKAPTTSSGEKTRQHSVWVGNLSFKTTQENLIAFFANAGEVTRVNMPTKVASRPNMPLENKGFAYVDFATPEAKAAAIALSEQPLVGRKLLIKDGDDFGGRPIVPGTDVKTTDSSLAQRIHSKSAQKVLRAQKQPPAPTLFVGNLPFETTEEDIRNLFEFHRPVKQAPKGAAEDSDDESEEDKEEDNEEEEEDSDDGESTKKEKKRSKPKTAKKDDFILKIRMGTFEDTGACKGFTFIDFSSIDNATSALINLKNHHFNGRDLKVEYAGVDAVRRGAAKHLVPAAAPRGGPRKKGDGKSDSSGPPRTNPSRDREFTRKEAPVDASAGGEPMEVDEEPRQARYQQREAKPRREKEDMAVDEKPAGGNPRGRDGGERRPAFKKDFERRGPRTRPTPGAALALAKRETAAIIPSQGKKTTF